MESNLLPSYRAAVTPSAAQFGCQFKTERIREFIAEREMLPWIELRETRLKAWNSEEATRHFQQAEENTKLLGRGSESALAHLKVVVRVAQEVEGTTRFFSCMRPQNPHSVLVEPIRALHIGSEPWGFSFYFLDLNPRSRVDALEYSHNHDDDPFPSGEALGLLGMRRQLSSALTTTLTDISRHSLLLPHDKNFPMDSPDRPAFESNRPLPPHMQSLPTKTSDRVYSIVFCNFIRLQDPTDDVRKWESGRLLVSELILGLSFIKPGGSILVSLRHLENWNTFATIYKFTKFSTVSLYKPACHYAIRSGFYLLARDVQPELAECKDWVEELKRAWYHMTFEGLHGFGDYVDAGENLDVDEVLNEWGEDFLMMGENVWRRQRDALRTKGWADE